MNVASIIPNSDCHVSHFVEVKVKIILVIVWRDPADPHASWFLSCKYPHRIVILKKEMTIGLGIRVFIQERTNCIFQCLNYFYLIMDMIIK